MACLSYGAAFAATPPVPTTPAAAPAAAPSAAPATAPATASGAQHFTLKNGMQLIVQPDRRAPTAVHMVWLRVGSMDEVDGVTGVAHVLRLLRDELEIAMALTGCRTLADAHGALADTAAKGRPMITGFAVLISSLLLMLIASCWIFRP
eukprot:gene54785-73202_t